MSIYDSDLNRNAANTAPLSPVTFLRWAATVYPEKTAVVHGDRRYSYRQFAERCRRLASALRKNGVGKGDTVSIIATNVPALLEAHYAVPMLGAVLNPLNTRLDAGTVAFILGHGEAKALLVDREFADTVEAALSRVEHAPLVVGIDDALTEEGRVLGEVEYEAFLENGSPDFAPIPPDDEWQAICLLYTSGTTGNPKGVVYHHRGAYLNALGNVLAMHMTNETVYLWTLPMFHCDGWTFTWSVTAVAGTHVCLRRVDPAVIFPTIAEHRVSHMCGAPVVLNMMVNAPDAVKVKFPRTVDIMTGGAAPPSAVIEAMEADGFRVLHAYGLTESYGPATFCAWQEAWGDLSSNERSARMARQGVNYLTLDDYRVADPDSLDPVPADGETVGELMLRGNTVMRGYLKNPAATEEAFRGGWFHTGDLGVMHPDGYVEIKDRSKDIIISGGENISSLEVEETLFRHPKILEAAVVARPDEKWGERPCAFVTLKDGEEESADGVIGFCRDRMARFKVPATVVFGPLPKTSTGKIQKFVLRRQAKEL